MFFVAGSFLSSCMFMARTREPKGKKDEDPIPDDTTSAAGRGWGGEIDFYFKSTIQVALVKSSISNIKYLSPFEAFSLVGPQISV